MNRCSQCGAENDSEYRFCRVCGRNLDVAPVRPPVESAQGMVTAEQKSIVVWLVLNAATIILSTWNLISLVLSIIGTVQAAQSLIIVKNNLPEAHRKKKISRLLFIIAVSWTAVSIIALIVMYIGFMAALFSGLTFSNMY